MARRSPEQVYPSRPPLVSHLSNSVPSTPHQYAQEFGTRSRSPSPHDGLSSHSPRSKKSESNGYMPALPKGRPTCKYETMAAFSRRRMQYDIGDAPLEKPVEKPKKALDPNEEDKLSGDMRELYDRLLPSQESEERRSRLLRKMERILLQEWPGNAFQVHVFGSSGNMLCTSESDVDICIQTDNKQLENMHMLAEALANNGMEKVICVAAAKVPIVKMWDPELKLAADINVNNTLALENTRMIKTYVQLDARVRPLAMVVKHWTKQRILNDAGLGGTLSSYAWICLILNFLQSRNPPILPALHQAPHHEYIALDGTESGFSDDVEKFKGFGSANKETIGELLFYFYRQYAFEFDYETSVISVRSGRYITRKEKNWAYPSKEGQWRLCIEEPFNITRNLGNSADSTAFRGIHLELRRAFKLLSDGGRLAECCEAYEFPPEEKFVFKKPAPGNKGITLTAPNQFGRQGRSNINSATMRKTRSNGAGKSYNSARRSSSGASFGRTPVNGNHMPLLHGHMMAQSPELAQYFDPAWGLTSQRGQQQLYAHYATLQGHTAARAHANQVVQASFQSNNNNGSANASPQKTPYIGSPRLEGGQYPPNSGFNSPTTGPSSPNISMAAPVRRGPQRVSMSTGSQSSTVRSQSQPARGLANGMGNIYLAYDAAGRPFYTNLVPHEMSQNQHQTNDLPFRYSTGFPSIPVMPVADMRPRQYVGYFVNDSNMIQGTPQLGSYPNYSVPPIPSFGELRKGRNSQELQPLNMIGQQHASRDPSPLGQGRQYGLPPRSAPLLAGPNAPYPQAEAAQGASHYPRQEGGLLIIDGSGQGQKADSPANHEPSTSRIRRDRTFSDAAISDDSNMAQSFHSAGSRGQGMQESHEVYYDAVKSYAPPDVAAAHLINGAGLAYQDQPGIIDAEIQPFPSFTPQSLPMQSPRAEEEPALSPTSSILIPSWQGPPPVVDRRPSIGLNTLNFPENSAPKPIDTRHNPLLSPVIETRTPSPTVRRRSELFAKHAQNGSIAAITNGAGIRDHVARSVVNGSKATVPRATTVTPAVPTPVSTKATGSLNGPISSQAPPTESTQSSSSASSPVSVRGQPIESIASTYVKSQWETKTSKKKKKSNKSGKKKNETPAGGAMATASPQSNGVSVLGGRTQSQPLVEAERKGG